MKNQGFKERCYKHCRNYFASPQLFDTILLYIYLQTKQLYHNKIMKKRQQMIRHYCQYIQTRYRQTVQSLKIVVLSGHLLHNQTILEKHFIQLMNNPNNKITNNMYKLKDKCQHNLTKYFKQIDNYQVK